MKWLITFGFKLTLNILVITFFTPTWCCLAAPCCARNSATPSLIVGDNESQVNVGISLGNVVAEVFDEGIPAFKSTHNSEITQSYRLDGAMLLSDLFQIGVSGTLINHAISDIGLTESTFGAGDTRLSLGYEFLTSWTYSNWKPQGYLFSVITLPTGRSKYESEKENLSDITGNGFYSFSIGMFILKQWDFWDLFFLPEIHYSLSRSFESRQGAMLAIPGFGGSAGIGVGWSPDGTGFRFGIRVHPRLDQGIITETRNITSNGLTWVSNCDTGLDASYLLNTNDSVMISYTDQTLLGIAFNSNLSRVIALNFQHRWER